MPSEPEARIRLTPQEGLVSLDLETQLAGGFVRRELQLSSSAGEYCQQKQAGTALVTTGKLPSLSEPQALALL